MLVWRRSWFADTTLVPAWWWALVAVAAWSLTESAAAWSGGKGAWVAPLRLAAVAFTFCPVLAVLGAKRPQHAAWSFVVLAFWSILALPAAETYFLQRGQRLAMGDARSWFLWILILVGPVNYLPTRQRYSVIALALAQVLVLSEYLPLIQRPLFAGQFLVALTVGCLAPLVAREPRSSDVPNPYDRLWFDFRDTFGLFWSLRLQERVNAVAVSNDWPLVLDWSGLVDLATGRHIARVHESIEPTLRTTMRGLLRRFVSGRWIAARMASDID
jgi:hypothetical protein